jgi:hypothetical protein
MVQQAALTVIAGQLLWAERDCIRQGHLTNRNISLHSVTGRKHPLPFQEKLPSFISRLDDTNTYISILQCCITGVSRSQRQHHTSNSNPHHPHPQLTQ